MFLLINRRDFLMTCGASVIALGTVTTVVEAIPPEKVVPSLPQEAGWYPDDFCCPRGYGENSLGAPGEIWRDALSPEGYF